MEWSLFIHSCSIRTSSAGILELAHQQTNIGWEVQLVAVRCCRMLSVSHRSINNLPRLIISVVLF